MNIFQGKSWLTDVLFEDCTCELDGGAIAIQSNKPGFPARLTNCTFLRCRSNTVFGGGMYLRDNAEVIIEDSYFEGCHAEQEGGAIASATLATSAAPSATDSATSATRTCPVALERVSYA